MKARFQTELIEGHRGVVAAIVPFDPEAVWKKPPVALEGRREGWLIKGTLNGVRFEGYVGIRWGRHFITVEPELADAAKVAPGDLARFVIEPTATARALAKAKEQSKVTTQPGRRGRR